jgi:hypothetical protein
MSTSECKCDCKKEASCVSDGASGGVKVSYAGNGVSGEETEDGCVSNGVGGEETKDSCAERKGVSDSKVSAGVRAQASMTAVRRSAASVTVRVEWTAASAMAWQRGDEGQLCGAQGRQ